MKFNNKADLGNSQSFQNNGLDVLFMDKYGDSSTRHSVEFIKNPKGFALQQQNNYYFAELYVETSLKNSSLYDENDNMVLQTLLKQDVHANLIKTQQDLTHHYSPTVLPEITKKDAFHRFVGLAQNPESSQPDQEKQKFSSFLQMLIVGAVLLRRSFEKIGIHYELKTQVRLNRDIAKMYKQLTTLENFLSPFI